VVDATPPQLVELAAEAGYRGVCLFMESMPALPLMPAFHLRARAAMARDTKARMQASGIELDLAYPFTLSRHNEAADFLPALETAASLGAKAVNLLLYDRDPARRFDQFAAFSTLAEDHGLRVAVEFYPPSQIGSFVAALALVTKLGRPAVAGVNIDLLHLMRSGGSLDELRAAPSEYLHYAQLCDGTLPGPDLDLVEEASAHRLLPGEGQFDLASFAAALPAGLPTSVEVPRNPAILAGETRLDRACRALHATAQSLALSPRARSAPQAPPAPR